MKQYHPNDIELTCKDCGEKFVWPFSVQQKFKELGYSQPKRCRKCSAANRAKFNERNKQK